MNIFGMTDIGSVRSENQDSYAVRQLSEQVAIAVVCDGMGGARAGNVASAIAVESFAAKLEELCQDGVPEGEQDCTQLLRQACDQANTHVYQLSRTDEQYRGMGTTLVAALLLDQEAYVINVGDSRCYHIHDGEIQQVSCDHSLVQMLVSRGDITPEQARTHPKKNLITRALGVSVDELLGNAAAPPAGGGAPPGLNNGKSGPSWLATHWYWLGLIPVVWGVWMLIRLLVMLLFVAA